MRKLVLTAFIALTAVACASVEGEETAERGSPPSASDCTGSRLCR